MPKSVSSYYSIASEASQQHEGEGDLEGRAAEAVRNSYLNTYQSQTAPVSPVNTHSIVSSQASEVELRSRLPRRYATDEATPLLLRADGPPSGYSTRPVSVPGTPRGLPRSISYAGSLHGLRVRNHSRHASGSFAVRLVRAFSTEPGQVERNDLVAAKSAAVYDDRVWYDQFTSTDWVHDSIADAYRVKELRSRKDWRGRLKAFVDGGQGWLLVAIIGVVTAGVTYFINIIEAVLFDYKFGYCTTRWWLNKRKCCSGASICEEWHGWTDFIHGNFEETWAEFAAFTGWVVLLSLLACLVTLQTKTTISSAISISTLDENLGADHHSKHDTEERKRSVSPHRRFKEAAQRPPIVYYPAAGSGVAEVKVILSGFVLHGYLGLRTLTCKVFGLILAVASGLSIGKEGPFVHIGACVGNIASRFVPKYKNNDGKRREVLSASAAAGVAVAFGAPIAGVLFSLEEVSYYFPQKTLFRTFFCCIAAALSLRFLDPYGTGKIVLFQVRYLGDWKVFEIFAFCLLGISGGVVGALFIKASRIWAQTFRRIPMIKKYPLVEVLLVAIATGVCSFWNRYTRLPVAELLFELASPCDTFSDTGTSLCPATAERIPDIIWYLCIAFIIKATLTTVTFGVKLPAGIYVPSMVVGGLLGRIMGHFVQWLTLTYPNWLIFASCNMEDGQPESCVVPGVYALVAAGATMCGVTRLGITLAVILFELTGSLEHVLPFALGVLIAKWTADALEPLSIYDLLADMNAYPYLDSKVRPVFTTDLGDITPSLDADHLIDISASPLVRAKQLRSKLVHLHMKGELDGGLPILKDGILFGLIPAPDLEFALDLLMDEESALCSMSSDHHWPGVSHATTSPVANAVDNERNEASDETGPLLATDSEQTSARNFTPYIDPAPVALDISSPMDLVFECFSKLGLRYICVLREGKFAGMVHKKAFVRYVKEVQKESKGKGYRFY